MVREKVEGTISYLGTVIRPVEVPTSDPRLPTPMKRVLFIAYAFPPVGGAGVQRAVKFVKYLPACGWQVSVLTVANPSVPTIDYHLLEDVPPETIIRRARTYEPSYAVKAAVSAGQGPADHARPSLLRAVRGVVRRAANVLLQPDPQILWLPQAIAEGQRLLKSIPHDAIVATAPPFSAFLIGASLARRTGLPLVLDYRDEWSISNANWENRRPGPLSRMVQGKMQTCTVRRAGALLATTRSSANSIQAIRDQAHSKARVAWIYNGFDPDDFPPEDASSARPADHYRLAYVGTLFQLTSVAPLVQAVRQLAAAAPRTAARLELVFAGRRTAAQQALLAGLEELPCRLVQHAYLDHDAALDLLRSSDGLCVLLSDVPGADRVMPAKLFEYMASRRYILAIAPRGELWDVLADYPCQDMFVPRDVGGIAAALGNAVNGKFGGTNLAFGGWQGERFSRPNQARELAALLDEIGCGPQDRTA